ncbi:hypothetical protein [Roseococcus sp. YIM B11640]|uniref:hypothetical protein n=1 Tax=Roseococcus sp. YIM B11640 TaxID=3133973 RepID=UPI003C7A0539
MAEETEGPAAAAVPAHQANVIRIAKAEEGSAKGEFWAVLRAVIFLICGILVLGWIIS